VNPETEKMFGYQANELLGKSVNLLIPELFQEVGPDNRKAFYQRPSIQSADAGSEIYGITQSGKRIPVELGLAEFDDDGGIKTLATVMDISEQVAITDELKRSNKELSDFVYVASHDLKAPLRGIMQLTSWIEEDIAETANEETRRNLALLSNRTSRLEKLLDDLLTYSRIGKNYGDRRSVNLCDLVHNTFELLDAPPGVRLKYRGSNTEIETLAIPLEVIIRNLLGNAIKHGGKNNDEIRLSVTDLGPAYEFSVRDKGPGIAPEHHSRIFDLFTTLKPRDEVEGSGMGLSIVKKLLDNHHGSIKVNSDGSNGSCFIFTWPKTQ
jgi:PAS domain S-box-containing protein